MRVMKVLLSSFSKKFVTIVVTFITIYSRLIMFKEDRRHIIKSRRLEGTKIEKALLISVGSGILPSI